MFPIEPGTALAEEVPHARLLRLNGAGHGVAGADWDVIVGAILDHAGAGAAQCFGAIVAP